MTYIPKTIAQFAKVWTDHGGVNSGIVGDARHTGGYHLGRDRLFSSTGKGWSDYSLQLQRDKNGLTNAASAMDFGKLGGSLTKLQHFSRWLVDKCKADPKARYLVREFIYTPNGQLPIHRYSGPDNKVYTGPGSGDNTHLWHSHLSFYRDTEYKDKTWLLNEYFAQFATPPDTSTGDDMGVPLYLSATKDSNPFDDFGTAKLVSGPATRVSDGTSVTLSAGTNLGTVQLGTVNGISQVVFNHNGQLHVVPLAKVTFTPIKPPSGDDGITQATVDAAVAAEKAACAPKVALAQQTGYNEGVATEKSRIRKLLGV